MEDIRPRASYWGGISCTAQDVTLQDRCSQPALGSVLCSSMSPASREPFCLSSWQALSRSTISLVLQSVPYTLHLALNRDTQAFHVSQESVDFQRNILEPLFSGTQGRGWGGSRAAVATCHRAHPETVSETQAYNMHFPLEGPSAMCPCGGHSTFQLALLHPLPCWAVQFLLESTAGSCPFFSLNFLHISSFLLSSFHFILFI